MEIDQLKLRHNSLLEIHKQNYDFHRAVIVSMGTVVTGFYIASIAALLLNWGDTTNGSDPKPHLATLPIPPEAAPYPIFILLLFMFYLLNESAWKGGYQKYVEEEINKLMDAEIFKWDCKIDGPGRWFSAATFGFVTAMIFVLVDSIYGVSKYIVRTGSAWSFWDIGAYFVLTVLLILGMIAPERSRVR